MTTLIFDVVAGRVFPTMETTSVALPI